MRMRRGGWWHSRDEATRMRAGRGSSREDEKRREKERRKHAGRSRRSKAVGWLVREERRTRTRTMRRRRMATRAAAAAAAATVVTVAAEEADPDAASGWPSSLSSSLAATTTTDKIVKKKKCTTIAAVAESQWRAGVGCWNWRGARGPSWALDTPSPRESRPPCFFRESFRPGAYSPSPGFPLGVPVVATACLLKYSHSLGDSPTSSVTTSTKKNNGCIHIQRFNLDSKVQFPAQTQAHQQVAAAANARSARRVIGPAL